MSFTPFHFQKIEPPQPEIEKDIPFYDPDEQEDTLQHLSQEEREQSKNQSTHSLTLLEGLLQQTAVSAEEIASGELKIPPSLLTQLIEQKIETALRISHIKKSLQTIHKRQKAVIDKLTQASDSYKKGATIFEQEFLACRQEMMSINEEGQQFFVPPFEVLILNQATPVPVPALSSRAFMESYFMPLYHSLTASIKLMSQEEDFKNFIDAILFSFLPDHLDRKASSDLLYLLDNFLIILMMNLGILATRPAAQTLKLDNLTNEKALSAFQVTFGISLTSQIIDLLKLGVLDQPVEKMVLSQIKLDPKSAAPLIKLIIRAIHIALLQFAATSAGAALQTPDFISQLLNPSLKLKELQSHLAKKISHLLAGVLGASEAKQQSERVVEILIGSPRKIASALQAVSLLDLLNQNVAEEEKKALNPCKSDLAFYHLLSKFANSFFLAALKSSRLSDFKHPKNYMNYLEFFV